ncbi:hypothetical protein IV203_007913 [Nitzschia inconspicua]|uniref:Uncharacterized protein n=1 Tax=Nitzschia inconspicua TaxID=303405 RepID=A0A9K3PLG9_9STRA|nr:hypothetical protein IV203_007913 [Nitzschia inconspicua]
MLLQNGKGSASPITASVPSSSSLLSPNASAVYGIALEYENDRKEHVAVDDDASPISIVYALPSISLPPPHHKGIVFLLHGCTHNSYKFFSPTQNCAKCVGLSEELQMSRWVLEQGYIALAVTSYDRKSGCWGNVNDTRRIRKALHEFIHTTHPELFKGNNAQPKIIAVGASSGGAMAGRLLAAGMVDAALVMVMGLPQKLLETLLEKQRDPTATMKHLYLAPMVKDEGTAKTCRSNYQFLSQHIQQHPTTKLQVMLDETSCQPLPVTTEYLWSRVPGMTKEAAQILVDTLVEAQHVDPTTKLLVLDPTQSLWRDVVTAKNQNIPASLLQTENWNQKNAVPIPSQTQLLWERFDLTPGRSPLAKALHRAWAFHEYCSESLAPAFQLFEQRQ